MAEKKQAVVMNKITFGAKICRRRSKNWQAACRNSLNSWSSTDVCVISNAMLLKAFYPEVPISVDASVRGRNAASHKNALEAMKMCQIDIVNE